MRGWSAFFCCAEAVSPKSPVLIALIAVIMCIPASFARSGEMGLGIDLGAAPCLEKGSSVTNFILGVKYQYQATSLIRLQADVDSGFFCIIGLRVGNN